MGAPDVKNNRRHLFLYPGRHAGADRSPRR